MYLNEAIEAAQRECNHYGADLVIYKDHLAENISQPYEYCPKPALKYVLSYTVIRELEPMTNATAIY